MKMAQIRIYHQDTNNYYSIDFDLQQAILDTTVDVETEYWLVVSTNIPNSQGGYFPEFIVKSLEDVPPGYSPPASDFNELCKWYYEYITVESQITNSSSSSSSMGYSTSSSSSSSSYGHSTSSSSSSSSSEESEGNISSSSTELI